MYTRYFGLTEAPFAISPNPRYLYMSELHREALAHLLYGITSDGCIILLTGDIGTGKTTLCRCLLEQLPEKTEVAVVLNPRLTARELLKTICEEFGLLAGHKTASIKTYIDAINEHLLQAHAEDRTVAVIVDEAQNLDFNVLEQLRLLTNLETTTRKLLRILLIGQPELREMLERPELSQVNQRITSRYHLTPLAQTDVRNYIQHRLNVAGDSSASLFTERAINHAISLTGGIPRLINVLCDRALLGAYAVNADHVDLEILKRAGEEIFPKKYQARRRRIKTAAIAATALAILAIPSLVFIPDWHRQDPVPKPAPAAVKKPPTQKPVPPSTPMIREDAQPSLTPPAKNTPQSEPPSVKEKTSENAKTPPENLHSSTPAEKPSADAGRQATESDEHAPTGLASPAAKTDSLSGSIANAASLPPTSEKAEPAAYTNPFNPPAAFLERPGELREDGGPGSEKTAEASGATDAGTAAETGPGPAPEAKKTVNTIKISVPFIVLKKAGPLPQKTADELLGK